MTDDDKTSTNILMFENSTRLLPSSSELTQPQIESLVQSLYDPSLNEYEIHSIENGELFDGHILFCFPV
jgi:hypothetical protein